MEPAQPKTMRILLSVIQHFVDGAGGSSRLAYDEALWLRDRGHEVWMLASTLNDAAPDYEYRNGIHFLRYHHEATKAFAPRRMFWYKDAIARLLNRHAPSSFDVVHGHAPLQHIEVCNFFPGNYRKCFSIHSPFVDELKANVRGRGISAYSRQFLAAPFARRIERDCLRRSDWVNAFSNFTVGMIRHYHGILADSVHVIPGWTDLNRFGILRDRDAAKTDLKWRTDVPVLFTLRRLATRMGLDRLITAISIIAKRGIELQMIIGGAGPMRESLEALTKKLGVSDKIRFEGFIPEEKLPLMYGACDAFVLPTAELECFGIIAVEALAAGRPVLATPIAAIPEILNHVEPRWLAQSSSAEHISDLLTHFILNKLPQHDCNELRGLAEKYWDGKQMLKIYCNSVLGTTDGNENLRVRRSEQGGRV